MPFVNLKVSVGFLGLLASPWAASAQPDPQLSSPALAWVTAGVGGSSSGLAVVGGVDVLRRQHLISFRGVALSEGDIFSSGDEFWDLGVLYGRARRGPRSVMGASVGIGVMGSKHRGGLFGDASTVTTTRISLPLAARAAWHPLSFLGLGIYGFANINSEQSFGGGALALELGRLR